MDITELRRIRCTLRHEVEQASHWRRIVRARLDLTIARAVLPERLGQTVRGHLAPDSLVSLPAHDALVEIARPPTDTSPVDDIGRLHAAARSLDEYETHVRRALMAATDALVERLSLTGAVP